MKHLVCQMLSLELLQALETPPIDEEALATIYGHLRVCDNCRKEYPEHAKNIPDETTH